MKLSRYDVANRKVLGEVPYPHTVAEVMFPDTTFAVIHAPPGQGGMDAEGLAAALRGSVFQLDGATSAKKKGDFLITDAPVAEVFWNTAEEAIGYGSILMTPCYGAHPVAIPLNVLVVEDGEDGTGDCHGKASPGTLAKLLLPVDRAHQFRLGVKSHGVLAKGTFVVDHSLVGDVDLVLPVSAFKSSYKPETGMHVWDSVLGVVAWSKVTPTRFSWQLVQWFSKETVDADLLPKVKVLAVKLIEAMSDTRALAEYLHLEAKDFELPIIEVILADKKGLLSNHPFVIHTLTRMLRRRWLDLAFGGGQIMDGLMALPDDSLPFGTFSTNDLPRGEYISTRYPLRYWGDVRVWRNVGRRTGLKGVVFMSHETAAALAGDFDGDYFQFAAIEDYPAMTTEIATWTDRPECEILKVKERKASPMTQLELARVMLENAESKVGIIALLIARASATDGLHAVPRLAQELQISVDKFKYNLDHDEEFLQMAGDNLPAVEWLKDRKQWDAYTSRPLKVGENEGTVGYLVQTVNAFWQFRFDAKPGKLEWYKDLLPEPSDAWLEKAKQFNVRYSRAISEAMKIEDEDLRKERFSKIYRPLKEWAEAHPDPETCAAAFWHAAHNSTSNGKASLPFHAFPAEIAKAVAAAKAPDSEKVTIVGMQYHDMPDTFPELDGHMVTVGFRPHVHDGHYRVAAFIGDARLGLVSSETPVRWGVGRYQLSYPKTGKAAVMHATVA